MQQNLTSVDAATIILEACQELGAQIYFEEDVLVQTLRGSNTHSVRFFNLKTLRYFGVLSALKAKPLLDAISWLIEEGFMDRAEEDRPLLLVATNALERVRTADLTEFAFILGIEK